MNDAHTMVHSIIQQFVAAALGLFLSGAALAEEIPNVPHPEFWGAELPSPPNMAVDYIGEIFVDSNLDLNVHYFIRPVYVYRQIQEKNKNHYVESAYRSFNVYKKHMNWERQVWKNPMDGTETEIMIGERLDDGKSLQEISLLHDEAPANYYKSKGYYVVHILSNDWCLLPSDYAMKRVDKEGKQIYTVMVFERLKKKKIFYKEHGKYCDFSVRERIGRVQNMALYPTLYDMEDGTMLYAPNRTPYLIRFHGKFESPFLKRHPSLVSVDADLVKRLVLAEDERLYDLRREKGGKINVLEKIDDMLSNLFKPMFEKKGIKP
ncbi:MAG: hypothetical protein HQL51_12305 [Magnetococcales bacterium]|nr:hypothetical protein [Magnetococcales bacterium]